MFLAVIQRGLGFKDHQVHVPVSFKISSLAASCYPHTTLNILLYFSAWCTAQFLQLGAVFTARLVGYLNCDRGGGGAVLLGKFQWSVQPRSFLEPVPYCISQTKNNMCPVSGLSGLNLFTRKLHVIFKPWFQRTQI